MLLTAVLIPIVMTSSYLLTYHLIPNFLLKGHPFRFFLYLCYTVITSLYLSTIILLAIFMTWANYVYDGLPSVMKNQFSYFVFIHLIVLVFVALNAMINWYRLQNSYLDAMKEKRTTELKFLQTQLQPHFLFNTLNNLYYLCMQKSDQAPEVVLKLSHLLDYVLSAGRSELVLLEDEWLQLTDYCYLEGMRYADRLDIKLESKGEYEGDLIPPLLLITLAENCFKHGVMNAVEQASIFIRLSVGTDFICLDFANSISQTYKPSHITRSMGIGLDNLRKQLSYHYHDRYLLEVTDKKHVFKVNLKIPK